MVSADTSAARANETEWVGELGEYRHVPLQPFACLSFLGAKGALTTGGHERRDHWQVVGREAVVPAVGQDRVGQHRYAR